MHTPGLYEKGWGGGVTGPTAPAVQPFCGGRDWPYGLVRKGMEVIALIPMQQGGTVQEMNDTADLFVAAPDLLRILSRIIDDLPAKRDWLDPDLEKTAKEIIARLKGE
jgi:hypothetical protein